MIPLLGFQGSSLLKKISEKCVNFIEDRENSSKEKLYTWTVTLVLKLRDLGDSGVRFQTENWWTENLDRESDRELGPEIQTGN